MPDDANTTARLKYDIDSGRSDDKINFIDPTAALLGIDDEAAGTPPTPEQFRKAHEQEVLSRPNDRSHERNHRTLNARKSTGNLLFYLVLGVGLLVVLAIWLIL